MTAPAVLAAQLVREDAALHAHVTVSRALAQQRIVLRLSDQPALSRQVVRLLPSRLARDVTDDVLAHRELARLTPPQPLSRFVWDRRRLRRSFAPSTRKDSAEAPSHGRCSQP